MTMLSLPAGRPGLPSLYIIAFYCLMIVLLFPILCSRRHYKDCTRATRELHGVELLSEIASMVQGCQTCAKESREKKEPLIATNMFPTA